MLRRWSCVGMLFALVGACALPAVAKAPNIVFILADDLDAQAASEMAQVRALISQQGLQFRRHYVSLSLCCPSRVSTLRGQFAHNTGIYKNEAPDGGFETTLALGLEASTVATWLKNAGYRTALLGKYLNGYPDTAPSATYIPPGWTEWSSPNGGTPYKGFDYTMNENGVTVAYGSAEKDYLTDVISAKASDFIRRSVSQYPTHPFFVYVAPYAPHSPATPAPRHENLFKDAIAPRTAAFNESDVSDKPNWVQATAPLDAAQIDDMDRLYRKRRQSLMAVDDLVQNLVNTLQSTGELANTYLMFASDNGFHQGQHRLESGKDTAYEEDLIVPLSVRGPGVPAGRVVVQYTANVDYAPTFADIAGIKPAAFVDGRSLMPFLKGQTPASWRQALLLEHKGGPSAQRRDAGSTWEPSDPFELQASRPGIEAFLGLRLADGRSYVEYDTGEREIYDNLVDPAQLRNVFGKTSSAEKARLASWLNALKGASGAALRRAELKAP